MAKTTDPPPSNPTAEDVLASLGKAADVARQAYMSALAANPGADLSGLYSAEMEALDIWSEAEDKALDDDPGIPASKAALDTATEKIRGQLGTLKDIGSWLTLLDNLVQLAATVGKFFV